MWIIALLAGLAAGFLAGAWLARRKAAALRNAERVRREEEQGALLSQIASGLAHEVRNPLSTLSMNLQLLREDWANPASEREHRGVKKLDTILRETQRLEKILEDLLRFSAGHRMRMARTDINALLDELLDFLTPQAEQAKIRLSRQLAAAPAFAEVDANLFRQAVHNLLVNAQQAMPSGGELAVRTGRDGADLTVTVADTGPGIPAEALDRIFNLYFSTKPGGTGLGLPMARKIIEEHRGTIRVSSEPGRGTTFTIRIPALDARR